MMRSRTKQTYTRLLAAGVLAAATLAASTSVLSAPPWAANTAKQAILSGAPLVAKRIDTSDSATYCATASTPGTHFTWTDMVSSGLDYSYAWAMWAASCPTAVATMRGAQILYAERPSFLNGALPRPPEPRELVAKEVQHATDGGAMVLMIQTDSTAQAQQVVQRAYYPPIGARDLGPGQYDTVYPASVTGGNYVSTYNDNLVVIATISTVAGVSQAKGIAALPGIHAIYLDAMNLESDSGYAQGSSDFNNLASFVRLSALASHKHLCAADRTTTPNTLTCTR
jgi:HpcH/HpaI aldolase/citrate lyase family